MIYVTKNFEGTDSTAIFHEKNVQPNIKAKGSQIICKFKTIVSII